MAKRTKLVAPSVEDLSRLEQEFRRETTRMPGIAPIAQVAAEAAGSVDPRPAEERERLTRDRTDAERFRDLSGRGMVMLDIPLGEIDADVLVRDRVSLNPEDMAELQASIEANGLRLPIEVYRLSDPARGHVYGLLSGYRRLRAMQALHGVSGKPEHARIRAVLRDPDAMGGTFAAMVEENEIRANLSHFERGRIAVIASQQGAFASVEAAVDALFPAASKGKRSKVRSFATVFEELGDLLSYPEQLRERDGLKLATALRAGHGAVLRDGIAGQSFANAGEEADYLAALLARLETAPADPARGGRPKTTPRKPELHDRRDLPNGMVLSAFREEGGWRFQLSGQNLDDAQVDAILALIEDKMSN